MTGRARVDADLHAVLERAAARVHAAYVTRRQAAGFTTVSSRHGDGTAELLVAWEGLAEEDKADDRASVEAVLKSLARERPALVIRLLRIVGDDLDLLDALRDAAASVDPPPADLPGRCAEVAAREDDQP